jgi:hypothetical protein
MGKFFLIKEHNYEKIGGRFYGQDQTLLPKGYSSYNEALADAQKQELQLQDVIYVVEVAAKRFGSAKQKNEGDTNVKTQRI